MRIEDLILASASNAPARLAIMLFNETVELIHKRHCKTGDAIFGVMREQNDKWVQFCRKMPPNSGCDEQRFLGHCFMVSKDARMIWDKFNNKGRG